MGKCVILWDRGMLRMVCLGALNKDCSKHRCWISMVRCYMCWLESDDATKYTDDEIDLVTMKIYAPVVIDWINNAEGN